MFSIEINLNEILEGLARLQAALTDMSLELSLTLRPDRFRDCTRRVDTTPKKNIAMFSVEINKNEIPARPFLGISGDDETGIKALIEEWLTRIADEA